jgi:hypothetical protein
VWAEIGHRLHDETRVRGDFAAVHVVPASSGDIPDTEEARLVILAPQHPHTRGSDDSAALRFARTCLETRGTGQRTNRNMLAFLAADSKRLEELDLAVRDFLAWQDINRRVTELDLSPQQASMAASRLNNAEQAVTLRLAGAYHWALVPVQPDAARTVEWDIVKAEGAKERLAERTSDKLKTADLLRVVQGARVIRQDLYTAQSTVWERGHIAVGELWGYYCRYPYLARLKNRTVLDNAVRSVLDEITWELEGFALATAYDDDGGRYAGLALPHEDTFGHITDTTLLVTPTLAKTQRETEHAATTAAGEESSGTPTPGAPVDVTVAEPAEPAARNIRFYGVHKLDPERYGRDWTKIAQEVLQHLAAVEDAQLEVRVEINATAPDGFPDDKVRIVTENAKVIKFEQFGFEDG